jgi:hypothetical protein
MTMTTSSAVRVGSDEAIGKVPSSIRRFFPAGMNPELKAVAAVKVVTNVATERCRDRDQA